MASSVKQYAVNGASLHSFTILPFKDRLYQWWVCVYTPLFWILQSYLPHSHPSASAIDTMISSLQHQSTEFDDTIDSEPDDPCLEYLIHSPSGFSDTSSSSLDTPSTFSHFDDDSLLPEPPKHFKLKSIKKAWKRPFQKKKNQPTILFPDPPLDRRPSLTDALLKSWTRRKPTLPPPPPSVSL
ncbi:hypothetical protein DM01DRAFT_1375998 [Hesseltinella vesiculosa]|uniref:Uncharacterized protein n=1 Tax=Hesseltinella vesiculosa TaxID=101127 RepID=A0A1X2GBU2_9FUNG|nr:hypothetical protein DM01DRAFT_1375998 [Hesseltinella vesiculosa]